MSENWFDLSWLQQKTTFDALKQDYGKSNYWAEFESQFQDGDEIWAFSTPPESWELENGARRFCDYSKWSIRV